MRKARKEFFTKFQRSLCVFSLDNPGQPRRLAFSEMEAVILSTGQQRSAEQHKRAGPYPSFFCSAYRQ
jgi:hypothetical protein